MKIKIERSLLIKQKGNLELPKELQNYTLSDKQVKRLSATLLDVAPTDNDKTPQKRDK